MKVQHTLALAAFLVASAAGAQQAPQAGDHAAHHAPTAAANSPQSEGEVRKVDIAQSKVTLRHGPLANLDMPAMAMVFTAASPKLLDGLKVGDRVRFAAGKKNGIYVVTAIEVAK